MINLEQRSYQKELMDGDDISFDAMAQTLKELNIINTRLGGHAITLKGLKKLNPNSAPLIICEIGCGGGDKSTTASNSDCTPKLLTAEPKYTGVCLPLK